MNITAKLNQANGRLRSAKVGVVIGVKGDRLHLRATFPPRPNSEKPQPYQQRLALGYHANPAGISLAETEARKVGALLDCRQFSWEPYLIQNPIAGRSLIGLLSSSNTTLLAGPGIQNQ